LTLWGILLTNPTALKDTTCLQDCEENILQSLVSLDSLQQLKLEQLLLLSAFRKQVICILRI